MFVLFLFILYNISDIFPFAIKFVLSNLYYEVIMINIGVITNQDKDIDFKYTRVLVKSAIAKGGKVHMTSDVCKELDLHDTGMDDDGVISKSEVVVCIGGDGTFLKVARKVFTKNIPILGVNLGSLGFLTEIDRNDIDSAIDCLIQGKYEIEERMMLETAVLREGKQVFIDKGLNDVVISRGALSRILHLKTYINNAFAESFPGDGLIVSSPTGSTAYSLSAGGPIVEPDTDLIIFTPICPHILYSRSFITTSNKVIKIFVDEDRSHRAMVTVDGQEGYEVIGGDCIEVKKALTTVKMVRIGSRNFFNVLRTKIHDRGERLRKDEI
jgi:NAD+ kinase